MTLYVNNCDGMDENLKKSECFVFIIVQKMFLILLEYYWKKQYDIEDI